MELRQEIDELTAEIKNKIAARQEVPEALQAKLESTIMEFKTQKAAESAANITKGK